MKAALLIILSLSALAYAGPAYNKNNNDASYNKAITQQQQQQQQQHMTPTGPAVELLKQWCFASQMSQPELTVSFKKLVSTIKSSPQDQTTEQAVINERVCQGATAQQQKQQQSADNTIGQTTGADAQAHELIKDVYMDALISCKSRDCTEQLIKIINSNQVDAIRASYYMTRMAVTEQTEIKDDAEVKQLADSFIRNENQETSEAIERQKLFAVTALIGKSLKAKPESSELKQTAEQVAKTIVERYIKPVSQQEVQQYQQEQQPSQQIAKKIAKRNAALKALANIPGHVLKEIPSVQETLISLAQSKQQQQQELVTVRQSAIECLEQNDQAQTVLKQIAFDQQEPIEVRVAAYRALMTAAYSDKTNDQGKQQIASQIVDEVVKHCEEQRNQQQDDQFVLYAISHLDNIRTSQQPEHQAIKTCISQNKQHYMQIQLLCKKFKQQLSDVRKSSRNYKLEQEFNQLESGLIVEGDIVYESKQSQWATKGQILPKLMRVNMSMPVMGETVNVVEVTLRQNQMDDEILSALKLVKGAKFTGESMSKVVSSFKSSIEQQQQQQQQQQQSGNYQQQQQQQQAEADLTIKVDGCTIVYLCVDDFKSSTPSKYQQHQRNTRSTYSIVDEIIEHLKRQPVNFNRGFNFNINERIAKVLDVEANVIAGLRFQSYAKGQSSNDFEIVAQVEPRFGFEAIVGPAKMSNKKLLQRVSTKTAVGLRLRYKSDELVDVQIDLPMNTMELFTVESQMIEQNSNTGSYSYLPESIYGQEDIYTPEDIYNTNAYYYSQQQQQRKFKRSLFESNSGKSSLAKFISGKQSSLTSAKFAHSYETSEKVARATGLRGKLRVVASPRDMTFVVSAIAQKYEPAMQGYRFQVQKQQQRAGEQQSYLVSVSTPGSRVDRTMQLRVVKSGNSQRTVIKSEISSPKMAASVMCELVHDGRQFAIKTELASTRGQQWRHSAEFGLVQAQQSQAGRIAATYKPYMNINSSLLKRPIALQGVVSYQQSPKTVISYELKCQTTGDYVQGKMIVDERQSSQRAASYGKRSFRRSMSSPIEILLEKDLTITLEMLAQIQQHATKVHQMIDWDSDRWALSADYSAFYKNVRKQVESQLVSTMKLDQDQQIFTIERKSPQDERKQYRVTVASDCRSPNAHQMIVEARYNGRRNSLVAYKHKINYNKISSSKFEYGLQVEYVDTERQINEKMTGQTRVMFERKMKTVQAEMQSRNKLAKVDLEYASLEQHKCVIVLQNERVQHKTEFRATQNGQFNLQSRTEKQGEMLARIVVDLMKPAGECKLVVEVPAKRTHVAADLKLGSGKLSSLAVQTPRFASKGEFTFETISRQFNGKQFSSLLRPIMSIGGNTNLRFKTDLKDMLNKEAYWMESAWNGDLDNKSYFRVDSPIYRTDLEFDPTEFSTKLGLYARSKRSVDNYESLYSQKESSLLNSIFDQQQSLAKMNLGNKLWMLRSIVSSPSSMEALKQQARRALFEYADRRQSHKHSFDWSPMEERVAFAFDRQPNTEYQSASFKPMRLAGDFGTNFYNTIKKQQQQPSKLSLASEYVDFDFDAMPFNGQEAYAKLTTLSRHPRSAYKKHESEVRYNKDHGYKAWMKHEDKDNKRHSMSFEADQSPKKWAKLSYESDKHGKGDYEHQWRKHVSKRSHQSRGDEEIYANKINFHSQSPISGDWEHSSSFEWEEPSKMVKEMQRASQWAGRVRRNVNNDDDDDTTTDRYSALSYLKHVNARLNSQTRKNQAELYNVDFDYQPESRLARLNVHMPEDMLHSSSFELIPSERTYKLQSKLYNRRTNQPSYDFVATTKQQQPFGLATAEQEPVFINEEHPMLERPLTKSLVSNLFRQPMKLDYSDKFGRVARLDYDQSPIAIGQQSYAGLRQKRAAVYYKDDSADFEHQSSYDFYPESLLAGFKPSKRVQGDTTFKTSTKYGPIVVRADSNEQAMVVEMQSPVVNAKLTGETSRQGTKMIKLNVDNKHQNVQLAKIVRKTPILNEFSSAHKVAQKIDQSRFEHQTELLVSIVDSIFKIKSQTIADQRPVLIVEGELNQKSEKLFAKINGERVNGQLLVDLVSKSANLAMDVDDKRTVQHVTRLVRVSDKYYSLDSMTTYKQQPLFKLSGKVSSMILSEPSHLFARRRAGLSAMEPHVSQFEAVLYEPEEVHISAKYDCLNKEAHIIFKNVDDKKTQETTLKFDPTTESIIFNARLTSPYGKIYTTSGKISLPALVMDNKCNKYQCTSQIVYSAATSGDWVAKYTPHGDFYLNGPKGIRVASMVH